MNSSTEDLNVFEYLIRHLWFFFWCGLTAYRRTAQQARDRYYQGTSNDWPRREFHLAFLACCARGAHPFAQADSGSLRLSAFFPGTGAYPITLQ
jgi:hypothetical protein